MCSPASFHTASSTHWPSWSHAPFWCGSPKSPRRDRAVHGATRSRTGGSPRAAGPARTRPRPRAWSAPARRPSGRAGSARGRAGAGRCARRCRAPTSARSRRRAGPARAAPGRRSHLGSRPARRHATAAGARRHPRRPGTLDDARPGVPWRMRGSCRDRGRRPRRSRTTPGPTCAASSRRCSARRRGRRCRRGSRTGAPRPRQVVLLVLDGLGLGPAAGAPEPAARAVGRWPAADHHGGAHHDGHGAQLHRHRADAGRARPDRLPHGTCSGEVLNVLRWVGRRRRRRSIPPATSSPSRRSSAPTVPVISPAELDTARRSPRPTCEASRPSATGRRRRSPWRSAASCAAGEPFVYAYYGGVDKIAHECGFGDFYDAELRAADRLVGDLLDVLPAGAALLVTADHGQVDVGDRMIQPDPRPARHGRDAVGRGPVPVVARPAGCDRRAAGRRRRAVRRRGVGRHPRADRSTKAGSAPRWRRPCAAASATWPSWPVTRSASSIPTTPGRSSWSAATARSPPAEMLVPLLAAPCLMTGAARGAVGPERSTDSRRD